MVDIGGRQSTELAERIRRWIIVAGYVLGAWAILQSALLLISDGLPFNIIFRPYLLIPIHRLAVILWLVSPLLLVIGCWGFQHHQRWAKSILLTYAGTWIAGVFLIQCVQFIDSIAGGYGDVTAGRHFRFALGLFDLFVYSSVYPVLLILCLTRPGIRDNFAEFRPGFTPVIDESGQ